MIPVAEHTQRETLDEVAAMIREIVGGGLADDAPITGQTSFSQDLELESIEFVALAEMVQERYGKDVDFVGWLTDKELEQILALRVGDLVELIERCRS